MPRSARHRWPAYRRFICRGRSGRLRRRRNPWQRVAGRNIPGRLYTHRARGRTEHRKLMSGTQTERAFRIRVSGNKTGAWLARYALEQLPVSHTFGIPGVHTTELYDQLSQSEKVCPILVTHECCGAFAADAISRTSGGRIGCLVIVPAAGVTHAMSGIGECYLDGIPLLVI